CDPIWRCYNVNTVGNVNTVSSTVNAAGINKVIAIGGKISIELSFDPKMPALEDDSIFYFSSDDEDDGTVADMNNLDSTIQVIPILTTRIHKYHPLDHTLVDLPNGKRAIGFKWVLRNKKDERGIMIRNKARLVAQGYTQEEGIDYDEFFAPVARIEAIKLFLAYASFKDFMVYQTDVKSAFLYVKIEEEVYVYQPPGFEDPNFPDRVYKVEKALSMIGSLMYLTSSKPDIMFAVCACARYQVNLKVSHLHAVKRIFRSSLDRKSTIRGCQFLGCRLISWQCKKQTVVANSTTEAEYFWSTAMAKTINGEAQLHALVDGKKIIITESSIRRDLRLADEDGIDCLPNSTIFEQLTLMGNPKRKDTQVTQSSDPIEDVPDEVVHKELGDSLVRAVTTASSLKAEQDSGNINKTQSKATPNESSSQGPNSGGGPRFQETMGVLLLKLGLRLYLNIPMIHCSQEVLDLEKTTTTQPNEIASLKRKVKKLEKNNRSKTHRLKRLYKVGLTDRVESSGNDESLGEDASKHERINVIDADEEITLVSVQDELVSNDADKEMFDVDILDGEEVFVAEHEVSIKRVNDEVNVVE
nr:copia protein [Tanacetum cinerariifolium]